MRGNGSSVSEILYGENPRVNQILESSKEKHEREQRMQGLWEHEYNVLVGEAEQEYPLNIDSKQMLSIVEAEGKSAAFDDLDEDFWKGYTETEDNVCNQLQTAGMTCLWQEFISDQQAQTLLKKMAAVLGIAPERLAFEHHPPQGADFRCTVAAIIGERERQ